MNISFKAKIYGLENSEIKNEFEKATKKDNNHSLLIKKDIDTGLDIFILNKCGKTTAKHLNTNIPKKENEYSLQQLIKLFNVLKIREAMNLIETKKRNKIENDFNYELEHALKEEEEKNNRIVSILESAGKLDSEEKITKLRNFIESIE